MLWIFNYDNDLIDTECNSKIGFRASPNPIFELHLASSSLGGAILMPAPYY